MPCRWSRRCQAVSNDALPTSTSSSEVDDWKIVRRRNIRMMRKQTKTVILMMALIEAMRIGPVQMVYGGKYGYAAPGEEDYGIAYTTGYILSWLYVCAFMIVFVPLFSWWLPTSPSNSTQSVTTKSCELLKKFNMVLLPMVIGLSLSQHVYYTLCTLVYVDSRPVNSRELPKNTKKNWLVRIFLLLGVAISVSCGYGAFEILERCDLAHVKSMEYAVIVLPIQVNIGMIFGTIMQFKMEKRINMKRAQAQLSAKNEEALIIDEKGTLLEV